MSVAAPARSYQFPKLLLVRIAASVAVGRARSIGADSAAALVGAHPSPVAADTHHLPDEGPFILVSNHYERAGLWALWGAMVISAAVRGAGPRARDLHWLMAAELLDVPAGLLRMPPSWTRAVLWRVARVYGLGLVSTRETGVVGGASGLRAAARHLRAGEPVGVMPEGTASTALQEARPGVGLALAWLTREGIPIVPVGIAEPDGVLTVRFGPPFQLDSQVAAKADRDTALRGAVMRRIAQLLPRELRGPYQAT